MVRDRHVLQVVASGERCGFIVAHHDGVPAYRGEGTLDYACGGCGSLLAVGVRPGMFRSFTFSCACGALNALE
jgi:hypothetical protein